MTSARDPSFVRRLSQEVVSEVRAAEPLERYSTYRIGGPATMVLSSSPEEVGAIVRVACEEDVPVFPLGLGSNLLFPDDGMTALVLRIGKGCDSMRQDGAGWRFGAGLPGPIAARKTAAAGWAGLHILVGVPGTVGGGVSMNAGCHGGEWADVVRSVTVVGQGGEDRVIPRAEIPFSYRQSGLGTDIVVDVEVELREESSTVLQSRVAELFGWRQLGTPFQAACCGSVFRNPPHGIAGEDWRSAGQLLEAAGLKGTERGAVHVSPLHANYFVNRGGATATEVVGLIGEARVRVEERFGILLQPEVKILRPDGQLFRIESERKRPCP